METYQVKKVVTLQPKDRFIPSDEHQKRRTKDIVDMDDNVAILKNAAAFKVGELLETDKKFTKAEIVEFFEAEQKKPEPKTEKKPKAKAE